MNTIRTVAGIKELRRKLTGSIGFVPTMGFLHQGHLALVKKARAENFTVVVSIFVNPTQFSSAEALKGYPRDFKRDLKLLEMEKVDIVFIPPDNEIYPHAFSSWVDVERLTDHLEGISRPRYFRGVTTICTKLFNIIQPTRAYFGQKDAQQTLVIKKMVVDLNMNLEIVTVPTVRENNGLAMSSRNIHLNPEEHQAATILFKALTMAKQLRQSGEKDANKIREAMTSLIQKEPLAQIDYVSIADVNNLEELKIVAHPSLASLAVRIGKTRLIDNMIL
ncbi:MAG: pantoate--beta-alanine ligase [Dehalococcoidia bacterium]|nr:pantoate--beta-alanine ligase [Dehalococcoidia bacterium]